MTDTLQFQLPFADELPEIGQAMPVWGENARGFPVSFALASVFTTSRDTAERKLYPRKVAIHSSQEYQMYFAGEELREDSDKEVWCQLMHLARGRQMSSTDPCVVEFSGNEFLLAIGWSINTRSYNRLIDCLDRLQHAQVKVVGRHEGRKYSVTMSFVSNIARRTSGKSKFVVRLDHFAAEIYNKSGMIHIDVDQRRKLSRTLTKRLMEQLLAAESNIFSADIADLRELFGSEAKSLHSFKQNLKLALEELRATKQIFHYTFEGQTLYVTKTASATINRGIPTTLLIHKAPAEMIEE